MADNSEAIGGAASGAAQGAAVGGVPGAIAGGAIGLVGGMMGSSSRKKAAKKAEALARQNAAIWAAVKIPTIQEQQIILQNPELQGEYTPEQLQYMGDTTSSMEGIAANEATVAAQSEALQGLSEVAEGGFSEGDKAAAREAQRNVSQDAQARQKSILNAMASRGTLGSGMELAAQLQGNQMATDQMSNASDKLIQAAQARSLQALGQQGQLSSQMRGQEFSEKSDIAKSRDAIARFNAANRQNTADSNVSERNRAQMSNLTARQSQEDARANTANQQQRENVNVLRTNYADRVARAAQQTGSNSNIAAAQIANLNRQSDEQKNLFGSIASGITQGYGAGSQPQLKPQQLSTGGPVKGPGTETSDSIPARLSDGEFVVKAAVVKKPGVLDFLHNLNDEKAPVHKYAQGGYVDGYNQGGLVQDEPTPEEIAAFGVPEEQMAAPVVAAPTELDPRFAQAMQERDDIRTRAGLLDTFLGAMEGSGGNYKANRAGVNTLNQLSENPMAKYKQLVAQETAAKAGKKEAAKESRDVESHNMNMDLSRSSLEKSGLDLDKTRKDQEFSALADDPNSNISVPLRERAKLKLSQLGMNIPIPDNMSAKQIAAAFPFMQDDLKALAQVTADKEDRDFRERQLKETIEGRKQTAELAANTKKELAQEKKSEAVTEGQKAVDKKYATDYNEFTSKGQVNVKNSISKLESLAAEMEKDQGLTESGGGRIASVLPDVMRDRDAIRRRDAARNEANRTLKALFPGALSDAEREAAAKEFYNDALNNEENAKILRQKIADLKSGLSQELTKAQYYEKHGTLKGFSGSDLASADSDYVTVKSPSGQTAQIRKTEVQKYLDKGATVVK